MTLRGRDRAVCFGLLCGELGGEIAARGFLGDREDVELREAALCWDWIRE